MDLAEKAVEILQYSNTLLTSIVSFLVFVHIIHRIKLNHISLTYYQNFLIVQALVYIFGSVLALIVNQRVTLSMMEQSGYSFFVWPFWLNTLLISLNVMVQSGESMLLTLFNIHRALLFLKPRKVGYFYTVATPPGLLLMIFTGASSAFFQNALYYCLCGYYGAVLFIVCACYFILRTHFQHNFYSDTVRKAQSKFSKCFLLQIVVQAGALALWAITPGFYYLISVFGLEDNIATVTKGIYLIILYMVLAWYPVLIGFIVKSSVSGLLSVKPTTQNVRITIEATTSRAR